jgi:glycosyltransferase involved in cell wall biosynthesis
VNTAQHPAVLLLGLVSRHAGRNGGGLATTMVLLANWLGRLGHGVALASPNRPAGLDEGITWLGLAGRHRLGQAAHLAWYLRHHKPKALLSFETRAGRMALEAMTLSRFRGVFAAGFHNALLAPMASWPQARLQQRRNLMQRIARRAAVLITPSAGLADELTALLDGARTPVQPIFNPIDSATLYDLSARGSVPVALEGKSGELIVSSGRLVAQKDFFTLLEACALVGRNRSIHLAILGDGPLRMALEQASLTLGLGGRVTWCGQLDNPFPVVVRAKAFVLASHYEGFGNALAEALALGIPSCATDCPHGPREILEHGRLGRLAPVGDPGDLAEAITHTLDHPMPAAVLRAAAQRFEPRQQVQRYAEALGLARP